MNARLAECEAQMRETRSSVAAQCAARVDALRAQRDETMRRLSEVRSATDAAWRDMGQGFEQAWDALAESYDRARAEFRGGTKS